MYSAHLATIEDTDPVDNLGRVGSACQAHPQVVAATWSLYGREVHEKELELILTFPVLDSMARQLSLRITEFIQYQLY